MNKHLVKGFWALVATLGLAGCSDLGEPIPLLPHAEVSVTTLDFGTIAVSSSATRNVIVSNTGAGVLNGSASVGCDGFSIQSGGGAFTVPPAGQHTVVVGFSPSAVGSSSCQLTLGPGIPPVDLNGTGALQAPGARCVLSVPSLNFGTAAVGGSKSGGYTISNPGTAPLLLDVVATCPDFVVISGGGPSTLPPGGTLPVNVQFVPRGGGAIACAIANGPGCPEMTVNGFATTVSYASDLKPIFVSTGCQGCHFEFTQQASQIVNVASPLYPGAVRIKPFDLLNSVLYQKITNTGRYGIAMPLGSPTGLPAAQADKFRRWILEGALNN